MQLWKGVFTMSNREDETIEPDEWDLQMIAEAEAEHDGVTVSLDDLSKALDVRPWANARGFLKSRIKVYTKVKYRCLEHWLSRRRL